MKIGDLAKFNGQLGIIVDGWLLSKYDGTFIQVYTIQFTNGSQNHIYEQDLEAV